MEFQMGEMSREMNNLSNVKKFSEDEILQIIKDRYSSGMIYTLAGPALVSVNPHRPLGVYGSEQKKEALSNNEYPHIFTIAERAHRGMLQNKNQVIVLSGESGSGKSVNANYILEYLSDRMEKKNIGRRLVHASPVLELFGNACTKNNTNSSRFGKYVEIYYESNQIAGANIKAFLLEKGRAQAAQDNFHSMVLLSELIDETKKSREESKKRMAEILGSFQKIGVDRKSVLGVFKALLIVVYLVQIEIKEGKEEDGCSVDKEMIDKVSHVIGIPSDTISSLLLERKLSIGKDVLTKKKTLSECQVTKNTLIRVIYEKIFESVVFLINSTLASEKSTEDDLAKYLSHEGVDLFVSELFNADISVELPRPTIIDGNDGEKTVKIGVLDIYGFEIMEENGFDQLCINYANEKIQAEYVRRIIEDNRKAFREEGIDLENMEMLSQAESVFEGSLGIIKLLDEESFMPGGTVKNWLNKVSSAGAIKTRENTMEINHYAGKVWYSADEFVLKNRNTYSDICSLLNQTNIAALHQPEEHKGRLSQVGVIGEFQKSLQTLLTEINKNVLHYVRCIKPGKTSEFCNEYVKTQLRLTGIYETVKIFMLGFYVKTLKNEFMERYSVDPGDVPGAQVGVKYVFLTENVFNMLEENKKANEANAASIIKVYLYGKHIYQKYSKIREEEIKRMEKELLEKELLEKAEKELLEKAEKEKHRVAHDSMSNVQTEKPVCAQIAASECEKTDVNLSAEKRVEVLELDKQPSDAIEKPEEAVQTERASELVIDFINSDNSMHNPERKVNATNTDNDDQKNTTEQKGINSIHMADLNTSPASDDNINPFLQHNETLREINRCNSCYKTEEKYAMQVLYLAERENLIEKLKSDLLSASATIKEKNMLIRDLSHKIEVMLYELSSGEYFKTTTNPHQSSRGVPLGPSKPDKTKASDMLFRKICKIFIQTIPPAYPSYYHSVCCSFALFRISAICPGGISENISAAVKEFLSSAYAVLVVKKSSIPLYTGFFLTNAIFIARTSPSAQTSEMLQSIYGEGCKAVTEEIVNFGFDFLFKPSMSDNVNLLSRLLKKPSLDSVVSHLKMVHSVLSNLYVPKPVIVSIFEYISKTIDALGFEYITKKEKKITGKNIVYLHNSLDTLSSLLIDVKVQDPYSCFPYLRKYTEFVEMQKKGFSTGSISLQLGPFTSSQLMACISSLSPDIRGQCAEKLQSALKDTIQVDRITMPTPLFSMPLNALPDDPNELYSALSICPEKDALCSALEEFGVPSSWLK
ncbi:myosin V [Nematocida minor]|uniref:myosin V n=1 Tax=Nematocida minor TaxID=1912983 RepID=UPI00221E96FD|nr:myosin V [Nematocida minor]KAI5192425.1 myosin V [Nematocida minor]